LLVIAKGIRAVQTHNHSHQLLTLGGQGRRLACPECDVLLTLPPLQKREKAMCPRCGHTLLRHRANGLLDSMAYSLAALVLLSWSLYYPFLGFSTQGQVKTMSLLEAGSSLVSSHEYILGAMVIFFIIVAPALLLITVLVLGLSVQRGRPSKFAPVLGHTFYEISHWNMVEVFVVGVLVSLSKIATMATVEIGTGFWSFVGFSLCMLLAVNSLDRHELWHHVRLMKPLSPAELLAARALSADEGQLDIEESGIEETDIQENNHNKPDRTAAETS